jgi:hypothetical protein
LSNALGIEVKGEEGALVMKDYMNEVFVNGNEQNPDINHPKMKLNRYVSTPLHYEHSNEKGDLELNIKEQIPHSKIENSSIISYLKIFLDYRDTEEEKR